MARPAGEPWAALALQRRPAAPASRALFACGSSRDARSVAAGDSRALSRRRRGAVLHADLAVPADARVDAHHARIRLGATVRSDDESKRERRGGDEQMLLHWWPPWW